MINKLKKFTDEFIEITSHTTELESDLIKVAKCIKGNKVFIVGNGGSASIASHVAEDFVKLCGISAITLHDPALMSCLANDYGWDKWVEKAVMGVGGHLCDVGIFISGSGESDNIINGCKAATKLGLDTITFTGFSPKNRLAKLGDINFHVDSQNYNVIELTHEFWLLSICEMLSQTK